MKNKKNMLLIFVLFNLIFGCSKPAEVEEKVNPDFNFIKLNYTMDSKGQKSFDLNGDGKDDLGLYFEKNQINGQTIHSSAFLYGSDFVNLSTSLSDFIVDPQVLTGKDTTYILRKLKFGDNIEHAAKKEWLTSYTLKRNNVLISLYTNTEPLGIDSLKLKQEFGTINKGDFYVGYRFYEYKNGNYLEWHNGWILLNSTTSSITIKEILYNKKPETAIKAGQKL